MRKLFTNQSVHLRHYQHIRMLFLLITICISNPILAQFSGSFAPSNWTFYNAPFVVNGSVQTINAPSTITVLSGNSNVGGYSFYTATATSTGSFTFNWNYATNDAVPAFDPFMYSINGGTPIVVPGLLIYGAKIQSGSFCMPVTAGNTFTFIMYTTDGKFGSSNATISNFSNSNQALTTNTQQLQLHVMHTYGLPITKRTLQPESIQFNTIVVQKFWT